MWPQICDSFVAEPHRTETDEHFSRSTSGNLRILIGRLVVENYEKMMNKLQCELNSFFRASSLAIFCNSLFQNGLKLKVPESRIVL